MNKLTLVLILGIAFFALVGMQVVFISGIQKSLKENAKTSTIQNQNVISGNSVVSPNNDIEEEEVEEDKEDEEKDADEEEEDESKEDNIVITNPQENSSNNEGDDISEECKYIGTKTTKKFHLADCRWVAKILETNKVCFPTREEAIEQGYIPCLTCNP